MTDTVVFHLPKDWLSPSEEGLLPFYRSLRTGLERRGLKVEYRPVDKSRVLDQVSKDEHLHLVNHGRVRHPRVLNAGVAYIFPFWNVDPWGIRAFSSIAAAEFNPAELEPEPAQAFFRRLRRRMVGARTSRYPQPDGQTQGLPRDAVAVFLQSEAHRDVDEACYLDRQSMVETVLNSAPGPVIIKPHPRDKSRETHTWLAKCAERFPALTVTEGNMHDILAVADRVVTINSAVGIEAFLHRCPVILCGQADFHHITRIARDRDALAAALTEPARRRAYDKYIYWYFGLNCLSATDPDLAGRFLTRAGPARM